MVNLSLLGVERTFPISRDPPEGGTSIVVCVLQRNITFPISRDPPEGGTLPLQRKTTFGFSKVSNF